MKAVSMFAVGAQDGSKLLSGLTATLDFRVKFHTYEVSNRLCLVDVYCAQGHIYTLNHDVRHYVFVGNVCHIISAISKYKLQYYYRSYVENFRATLRCIKDLERRWSLRNRIKEVARCSLYK